MRIYVNELIKAFCRRSTIGIFIALSVLNGVLLWVNDDQKSEFYTAAQYRAAYSDLDGLDTDEAYEKVKEKAVKLRLFEDMSFGMDITDELKEYPNIDVKQLMQEYKSKSFIEYTNNEYSEQELTNDILKESEVCAKYDDYLQSIDTTAKKMTSISLFAEPGTFSYKNIEKTPDDFAHLKGSKLMPAPSKGIQQATGFLATDLIGLLMIMTVIVTIVTREKELNQTLLSRTAFKGRKHLGSAKLFTCFTAAFVVEAMLYSVNFSVSYFRYGFGDMSRQIQSVYDFNGSELKITVLQYIGLFLLAKLVVYCVIAGLIYLVTVISDTSVKVYGILGIALASEAVLYYKIPGASYLSPVKYINIIAFANTKDLFAEYLNLNMFGNPIDYKLVFVISAAVLLIAFSVLAVLIYSRQKAIKSRTKRPSLEKFSIFKGRNTSLFLQECYKIFIGGKVLFILIAFALFTYISYEPMSEHFTGADEIYYKQYMLRFEGEFTDTKTAKIQAESDKFEKAQADMQEDLAAANGDELFIMMKYQDILAPQTAFERVKEHADYLSNTENGEFVYDSGYQLLTGGDCAGNKDITMALTAMAMIICCLTYVYSIEYQTGASVLLKTSKRGRFCVFVYKVWIGAIIVTIIYILTYVPYYYNVLNTYGLRGINAPAYSMEHLKQFGISIKWYLIIILAMRFIALIIAMLIIYYLSSVLKSFVSALLTSTAVLVLPLLLSLLGIEVFDWLLLDPIIIGNVI